MPDAGLMWPRLGTLVGPPGCTCSRWFPLTTTRVRKRFTFRGLVKAARLERPSWKKTASSTMVTVSHVVQADLWRWWWWCCRVWSGESAQRWGGGVFADRPLVHRAAPTRPSDVCVSSLMKKFWNLGETLLSAEQTRPPRCPQTPNSCPTQTSPPQASGFSSSLDYGTSKTSPKKLHQSRRESSILTYI